MILPKIPAVAPKAKIGKRSWKRNVWGNVVGYEGGRRVEEFGCDSFAEPWAAEWVSSGASASDAAEAAAQKLY